MSFSNSPRHQVFRGFLLFVLCQSLMANAMVCKTYGQAIYTFSWGMSSSTGVRCVLPHRLSLLMVSSQWILRIHTQELHGKLNW